HAHRATLAWLPNFAFSFLAARTKTPAGQYDLSCLRALINCSEPVSHEAMQAFADRFATDRFAPEALQTCYAMAESVFAVTTSSRECPPRRRYLDRAAWHNLHRSLAVDEATAGRIVHVSNGRALRDCQLCVVADDGRPLAAGEAGQILIRSPFL